jgi:prolyl oligopeptidase
MKRVVGPSFAAILVAGITVAQSPSIPKPPETPKRPVTDEYHGVTVRDDYRWLEDWSDPETKRWSAAENAYARAYLDHLPARAAIKERFKQLISESSANYSRLEFRGGVLFALRHQPPQQQAVLVTLRGTWQTPQPGPEVR